jgi:hypothetical protein
MLHIDELIVEDLFCDVQKLENGRITHRVVDVQPVLSADNNASVPQDGQLLRQGALFRIQFCTQLIDPKFAFAKGVENGDPEGMCQRFEEFGLKTTQVSHAV